MSNSQRCLMTATIWMLLSALSTTSAFSNMQTSRAGGTISPSATYSASFYRTHHALADQRHSRALRMSLDPDEFKICVGRAMDTLESDYPEIFTADPDFSIYDRQLTCIDPSGVTLRGVHNYKQAFRLLHMVVNVFYCPENSSISMRMCFDEARQNVRILWNAEVVPKAIFGGTKTMLHVDGISVYEFSLMSGNITQHRIEHLMVNDAPVTPQQGLIPALQGYAVRKNVDSIPIFSFLPIAAEAQRLTSETDASQEDDQVYSLSDAPSGFNDFGEFKLGKGQQGTVLPFQNFQPVSSSSSLFDSRKVTTTTLKSSSSSSSSATKSTNPEHSNLDWDAFEQKNKYRQKFNLKPLTPEEFLDVEKQVAELSIRQQQRAEQQQAAAARNAEEQRQQQEASPSFLKQIFGKAMEDTCESNFDCERPQVCCDFGFKKMCCSSGMRVLAGLPESREGQLAEIPVIANPGPTPGEYPRW